MPSEETRLCFVGIDVSKDTLDVYIRPTQQTLKIENKTFGPLVKKLKKLKPELIVLEATGGYEIGVLEALSQAGLKVYREHPLKVYHHAKGRGILAKTDRLDAGTLAHYAECFVKDITLRDLPSQEQRELQQLVARRKQLVEQRTMEMNREKHPALCLAIKTSCRTVIDVLESQIQQLEQHIQSLVEANENWQRKKELLQSVAGVGEATATLLLVNLPELGQVSRKVIAALVGVAPYRYESGTFKGQQHIRGGRKEVRTGLYMATMVAKKYNPELKAFYEKLLAQGKKKKVALVACMHKLLRMLNAILAKNEPYHSTIT
jgi:transposase